MAPNAPMPFAAVACSTWLVVVSPAAPIIYSVVLGKVRVTAPLEAGYVDVVRFVDVPVTS